ncbi:nucleosomal binding [Trichoderma arundinaceum]|uniref:Nucleosomal binding n=1 Tax=Trichoderma arundinaceum TaxID=490622 RepID=A0A395NNH2_TRIAR|nr:nucleosomal binding [Trichoderma arundinaceum]
MEESGADAAARPLRILAVASFIPSFALCIAHGVLSHKPVPAVGLVPQAVSVVTSIALLRTSRDRSPDADVASIGSGRRSTFSVRALLTHPIIVFIHDMILAAALMVVLVFTWTHHGRSASLSMLAAYATLPLLTSFFCHLFAAAQAVYQGLAIHGFLQWVAWQILPPDCPNCEHHLRPSSLPEIPWLESIKSLNLGLRYPWRRSDAPLLAPLLAEDDPERYRDHPEDDETTPQPQAVEVRSKRNRKNNATPAPSNEVAEADLLGDTSVRDD